MLIRYLFCCHGSFKKTITTFERLNPIQIIKYERELMLVFNVTFNNISFISWQAVVLLEEKGEIYWQTSSHKVVSRILRPVRKSNSEIIMEIGTDCKDRYKSSFIVATMSMDYKCWLPINLVVQNVFLHVKHVWLSCLGSLVY